LGERPAWQDIWIIRFLLSTGFTLAHMNSA